MRRIVSVCISVALLFGITSIPISAQTIDSTRLVTADDAVLYDTELKRYISISVEQLSPNMLDGQEVSHYQVFTDGKLDYTIEVDLSADTATMIYTNGNTSTYVISETVTMEKIPGSHAKPIVEHISTSVPSTTVVPLSASTNYIGNEPFEIDAQGNQVKLGTVTYAGYEAMGHVAYNNPNESGYLQRKAAGYTTFDSYRFTISQGTTFGAAVGIIVSLATAGGTIVASTVISALLSAITGAVAGSIYDSVVSGTFQCREYRWDYRVRHNSNFGTLLKTATKYRYWWEMYDNKGNRSFEYRNNLIDGWQLSNYDLIASALGRIAI